MSGAINHAPMRRDYKWFRVDNLKVFFVLFCYYLFVTLVETSPLPPFLFSVFPSQILRNCSDGDYLNSSDLCQFGFVSFPLSSLPIPLGETELWYAIFLM